MDFFETLAFVDDSVATSSTQTRSESPNRWDGIVCRTGRLCPSKKGPKVSELIKSSEDTGLTSDRAKVAYELVKAGLQAPDGTKTYTGWQYPVLSTPKRMGKTSLRPHQMHAVNFMLEIWRKGMNPLLAHGMGLGKTIEIIGVHSLLADLADTEADPRPKRPVEDSQGLPKPSFLQGPTLLVVPKNLIGHWIHELGKHMQPAPNVHIHHGPERDRMSSVLDLCAFEFVITTYSVLWHEAKTFESMLENDGYKSFTLFGLQWNLVVLDEAHTICNPRTSTAQAAYLLQARLKTAITGTPFQNHYRDVQSLMSFLEIPPWNDFAYFRQHFVKSPSKLSICGPDVLHYGLSAILALSIKAFVVRLTKYDKFDGRPVVDYPAGAGPVIVRHEMTDAQSKIQETLELQWNAIRRKTTLFDSTGKLVVGAKSNVDKILALMLAARLCLVHMACKDAGYDGYADQEDMPDSLKIRLSLEKCREKLMAKVRKDYHTPRIDWILDAVRLHLQRTSGKVIVFSEFLCVLDAIAVALGEEGFNQYLIRYDGTLKDLEKRTNVQRFASSPQARIILITIRSGGVGLSFTAATMIIHATPCWNPHLTDQGTDRAIRPGQTREVLNYHLKCDNSIEDKVFAMHDRKRHKSNDLYDPSPLLKKYMEKVGQWSEGEFIKRCSDLRNGICSFLDYHHDENMGDEGMGSDSENDEIESLSDLLD